MSFELVLFYTASAAALFATVMTITRLNAAHALLYLIASLLAVAVLFYLMGAPFAAGLEVIIYAGAIMVLFVFVIMMLNMGQQTVEQERQWLSFGIWIGPSIICLILLAEVVTLLVNDERIAGARIVSPKVVGALLYGPYLLAVELASMLLLAGLVGAYHLARPLNEQDEKADEQ
ncbi:MAG: NADH-quinone oxidoreductase subunit J [Pseudomonadales bacterium]|nr:NADH-quinone oxidoreductase subunit J [Pseudomonadales bacterium]